MKKSVLLSIIIFGIMATSLFAGEFKRLYHGTNSLIFALLPHTNYKLAPSGELIFRYEIAPLSGELGDGIGKNGIDECNISFSTERYVCTAVGHSERIKEKSVVESVMAFNPNRILAEMGGEKHFENLTCCSLRLIQYRQLCPEKYNDFLFVRSEDIKKFQDSIDGLLEISREEEFLKLMETSISESDIIEPACEWASHYNKNSSPKTFEEALEILKVNISEEIYSHFLLQFQDDAYKVQFWANTRGDTDEQAKDLLKCAFYLLDNNMLENKDEVAEHVRNIKTLFLKRIELKTQRVNRIKDLLKIAFKAPDWGVCEDIKKSLTSEESFSVVLCAHTNREGIWGMGGFRLFEEFAITGEVPFGENGIGIIYVPVDKIEVIKRWIHDHSLYLDCDNIEVKDISLLE